jgi:hypothetical protein
MLDGPFKAAMGITAYVLIVFVKACEPGHRRRDHLSRRARAHWLFAKVLIPESDFTRALNEADMAVSFSSGTGWVAKWLNVTAAVVASIVFGRARRPGGFGSPDRQGPV